MELHVSGVGHGVFTHGKRRDFSNNLLTKPSIELNRNAKCQISN